MGFSGHAVRTTIVIPAKAGIQWTNYSLYCGVRRQVGMTFSRHAVNTSLYAHRQPSMAGDVLENVIPTCRDV